MEDPDWAKVLQQIYRNKNGKIKWPNQADGWQKSIDGTGLSFEQEDEAICFLHESGLLQKVDGKMDRDRQLTKRGFKVAHEREQNKKSEQINKSIRNLTVILAIAALIQAISGVATVATVGLLEFVVILIGSLLLLSIGIVGLDYNWF